MEASILSELLAELETIKWLLIALVVGVFLLVFFFFLVVRLLAEFANDESLELNKFRREAQDRYDRGRYKQLRGMCERRLKLHPDDKWACFYLGLAFLRLEKYADAKAHFTRVRELDPQWSESVIEYLDEIHDKLAKNKPTQV